MTWRKAVAAEATGSPYKGTMLFLLGFLLAIHSCDGFQRDNAVLAWHHVNAPILLC
jgi:hypothetical protein